MLFQPVLMLSGYFITILGISMIIPILADVSFGNTDWHCFLYSSAICIFVGQAMYLSNKGKIKKVTVQQGFLLTAVSWLLLVAFAAIPFVLSGILTNYGDAFFEAMSGLTTTGATVITGLEAAPPGILLWRSILNFLGGVGIIVLAVAVFPFLSVGGMQIFKMESSETAEKIVPKIKILTRSIILIYLALNFACMVFLYLSGMNLFDALNHALATIATGGFSTKDSSIGYYNSPLIEFVLIVFMISGALPLTYYVSMLQKSKIDAFRTSQIKSFFKVLFFIIAILTLYRVKVHDVSFLNALREVAFNVTSILTDCGFASTDYGLWGHFSIGMFLVITFIGGCTGSTSGAIKIFRWQILGAYIKRTFVISKDPNRVYPTKIGKKTFASDEISSVIAFIALYFICFAVITLLLCFNGVDFLSSASAVSASMANSGPGLGDIVGPAGTYKPLPYNAKWILSFAMLLGRLELFTLLVIFTPSFWKK